ncbi:cache domain-containing protein [Leucobacter massiliensis]|uniref:Cache domain-containing protein n=1 Tax=Leucobacter massiliensis TaxID=1686285 RepID=A0A2S9QPL5_9MICO|nr:cache domain-containing protein [Leucobacter massiliensis]PRI11528.1 hypothetical protein B4915_06810 [Leucobacter massiliensis]
MTAASAERVAAQVEQWLDERFAELAALTERFIGVLDLDEAGRPDPNEAARRRLRTLAVRYLAEHPVVDGCGIIFSRAALGLERGHLEWWVREDETRFASFTFGVVPGGDRFYDYEHHEWFTRAYDEGLPALVGPYYDFLGVEAYIVTLTLPAAVRGTRIGVVAADIQVADLEGAFLPVLQGAGAEMALVGSRGNVLVGNSSRLLPGTLVSEAPAGFERRLLGAEGAGIELIYRTGDAAG